MSCHFPIALCGDENLISFDMIESILYRSCGLLMLCYVFVFKGWKEKSQ